MLEDFINAIQNFKRNKTRTILSLLGVIIGVASVIVITSMGNSSTKQVQDSFGSNGLDVINIRAGYMRRNRDAVTLVFDEKFRNDLFNNVEGIKHIWYKNTLSSTITFGETSATTSCAAIEYGYLEMYNMELEAGNFFSVTDIEKGLQKLIISRDLANDLFPMGDALGKNVMLVANNG